MELGWVRKRAIRIWPRRLIDRARYGYGTIRVRGVFPTPMVPSPWAFVRSACRSSDTTTILVPDGRLGPTRVSSYPGRRKDDKVERRDVRPGVRRGDLSCRERPDGPEDRVVVRACSAQRAGNEGRPDVANAKAGAVAAADKTSTRLPVRDIGPIPACRASPPPMFSRFFIDRPIFANVIAIVTMLVGVVALFVLPIEQYPADHAADGAGDDGLSRAPTPRSLADTVAAPIEQEVNGVEDMLYMSSTCSSDGSYKLTVTFEVGTDLDKAQVLVQNRVAIAMPRLPEEVQRQGVTAKKQSTNIILVVVARSRPTTATTSLYLSNYATLRVKDELSRDRRASATSASSAPATTACGSGSIPRSSRPAT